MNFATPENLIWLWSVPVILVLLVIGYKRKVRRLARFIDQAKGQVDLPGGRNSLRIIMYSLGFLAAVLALAGPQWGFEWLEVNRRGSDVVIVVDVSRSMMVEDVKPNRMERAKREVYDLLARMRGDRVGLVAFAGTAFVQCPLTEDYSALKMFLNYLSPELIPVQGTDIGRALMVAEEALRNGGVSESSGKAVVLITDGEDIEKKALATARKLGEQGIKLFTLGIGSKNGGPIPVKGGGFKKDKSGNLVISKPSEELLHELAQASGGVFARSILADGDLVSLYDNGIRTTVEQQDYSSTRQKLWYDRFQWFLWVAFLLLVLEPFIPQLRKSSATMVALLGLVLCPDLSLGSEETVDLLNTNPQKATEQLQSDLRYGPDDPRIHYNLGVGHYRTGDYEKSLENFGKALQKADSLNPGEQGQLLFNFGNALAKSGKLNEAIKAYDAALKVFPDAEDVKGNREAVQKLMEQQPQNQDQQNQDQQNQDQQNQDQQNQDQQNQDQQNQDQQNQDQQNQDQQNQDQQNQDQQNQDQQNRDQQNQDQQNQDLQNQDQQNQDQQNQDQQNRDQQNQDAADDSKFEESRPLSEEEAESVLRRVEDNARQFHYRPEVKDGPKPTKDW